MKPPEIRKIASYALGSIDSVLNHWLPGGRRNGQEYLPLNPKRGDSSPGSFSVNLKTGKWADFADHAAGNDLVSLVAYLEDCKQSDAAKNLAEFLNIRIENDPPERAARPRNRKGDMKTSPEKQKPQETADGWKCVMPVPDGAPKPPSAHPKHGKPSRRYEYLTGYSARTNFYHDRYDKPAPEKKQFAPLTLWQKGKTFKWQYKAPPDPRPLYGLIGLFAYADADADCWIVEGEKAAVDMGTLLPNHPVLTWQGGSMATAKADYTPLSGRNVIIWPDNDAAGMKACRTLIDQLRAVKAKSIRVLDISKLERASGQPLQLGDDAADLVASGWTPEQFAEFLKRDGVLIDADAFTSEADQNSNEASGKQSADAGTIERFTLFDKGLFVTEQNKDGSSHIRWICSPIKPLAMVRTEHGREWGLLVWLVDPDGKEKKIILGMRQFNGDALAASGELLDAGLRIGSGTARKLVIEYLQASAPDKRAKTTNKTGWHGVDDEMVFVLPEKTIGESSEDWLYGNQLPDSNPYRQKGTLKQWRENVAALCADNSRLVSSVSTAFAAPMLHLVGMESGGFQLTGKSSTGKSTALFVAASVCGGRDYLQQWKSTGNGMEGRALSRNDSLLVNDEIKQLEGKIAGDVSYMVSNGSGKERSNANGTNRPVAAWRVLFLSSGELSLSQHVTDAGQRVDAGMEVRFCDIPADAGADMGLFENIHGYESASKFAETLKANAGKYYGTAFIAFIEYVLQNREAIPAMLKDCEKVFAEEVLTDNASGQARRVAGRFALVAAAGELATQWGITGWRQWEAMKAAITCFKAWLEGYGGETNKEERNMLSGVRRFLEANFDRFVLIDRADDSHAPKTLNRAGYRKPANDGLAEYLVLPETFKSEICKGFNYRDVAKLLVSKGYMVPGDGGRPQHKVNLPHEGWMRVFHILPSIWGDNDDGNIL